MFENLVNNTNLDISYDDFFIFEFRRKNITNNIYFKKLHNVWIPTKNISPFLKNLETLGFICHQRKYHLLAISEFGVIQFDENSYGLSDGAIHYVNESSYEKMMKIIDLASDHNKKLHIKWFYGQHGDYEEIIDTSDHVTR